jgi:UDP-glucose 4-epimerase
MNYLNNGGESGVFNLGNGLGYSVNEVVQPASKVTRKEVPRTYAPRRAGDPARLVADATLAKNTFGWQPQYSDLAEIIQHAWAWELAKN